MCELAPPGFLGRDATGAINASHPLNAGWLSWPEHWTQGGTRHTGGSVGSGECSKQRRDAHQPWSRRSQVRLLPRPVKGEMECED